MPHILHDGLRLAYRDTRGRGMPVVLLHAFPFSSEMWAPQVDALGAAWRVVAPDLKGFGGSDAPADPSSYTMESFAYELEALLRHLRIGRAVLVGLSMGGYVALAFLRRYPDAVAALVLADTRAEADAPEVVERRTNQQRQVLDEGTAGLVDALSGSLLAPPTLEGRPDVVARTRALMDQPPAGMVGALEAMKTRPDATADLASISVPTLVLVGEHDNITPLVAARRLSEGIPGARLVVLPSAGHVSSLEAPEAFSGAIAAFLRRIEPAAPAPPPAEGSSQSGARDEVSPPSPSSGIA
jgi:3-oxoadipate enol-lactonase